MTSKDKVSSLGIEGSKIDFEIEQSKIAGEYALKLIKEGKSKYILSKYAPRTKISEHFILDNYNRNMIFVVFGFGFGYGIEKIYKTLGKDVKIIVIEPQEEILNAQKELVNLSKFDNITFLSGNDFVEFRDLFAQVFAGYGIFNAVIISHPHYHLIYDNYLNQILQIINEIHTRAIININTVKKIDQYYVENCINNSKRINTSYDFSCTKDKFKGVPAVIVSAGPSLDKNLAELENFNGIILCAGRTIDSVRQIGKEPDYVCLLDYSEKIKATFNKELDVPLVSVFHGSNHIVGDYNGKVHFVDSNDLCKELLNIELPEVMTAGSVSTLCLETAYYMGCDPIVYIGQDLALDGDKSYSKTCNIFEDRVANSQIDVSTSSRYSLVEGYYGEAVVSDGAFISCLRWIEAYIKDRPETTFINSTEGGAKIHGTIQMPLKEMIQQYSDFKKPEVETPLLLQEEIDVNDLFNQYLLKLDDIQILIDEAIDTSKLLSKEYRSYKPSKSPKKVKKFLKTLDNLDVQMKDKNIMRFIDYLFTKFVLPTMINQDNKDQVTRSDLDNARAMADSNIKMYEGLNSATEQVISVIKNNLEVEELT
ncbi:MAG: hypothetical protein ATN35_07920 [Epulopiscium sp. Nele67-Bin004]|nr:MAG: hypothetical protein ATN35_07920 [Epulopiscium sp. Nele67-Bin004]